ncbi:tRNA-dihydrouridine synthase [Chloropicon roscoffensis]|uniref:tRNA-dihydrouridine synthase n=2 Tax=Chloropicon roscoffensis TaxID=1461544 RepID=A0AAX4PAB9_9CHLO
MATAIAQDRSRLDESTSAPLLSVAPMMEWTDVYYRNLARLLSRRTWLYTEMIVDKTLIYKEKEGKSLDRYLHFPEPQHPVVLQLGGNSPPQLEAAVKLALSYEYDEINLNCGCPSPRVSGKGCFGAALMKDPPSVRAIVEGMSRSSPVPVTIKCRLGVDDNDTYPELVEFVRQTSENLPIDHFIMHARKAFLQGLSPAQNRDVPPLKYDWVFKLSEDFPHLKFSLNGGVKTLDEAKDLLERRGERGGRIHGVMIGRAAYKTPWHTLADADRAIFGEAENPCTSRRQLLRDYCELCDSQLERQSKSWSCEPKQVVRKMAKPLLGLFYAEPGTNKWKRTIEEMLHKGSPASVTEVVERSMEHIPAEILDASPQAKYVTRTETDSEGNRKRVFSVVD